MEKYLWYSGATDITGTKLAEALVVGKGKTKPKSVDIVIGWGTKTKEDVNLGKAKVLNHPNAIRKNRNKLETLKLLAAHADVTSAIMPFSTANNVKKDLQNGKLSLPIIGRTTYHQGGKGFWLCITNSLVDRAIANGAKYFQNFIDIDNEYRLHVAFGKVIYAVKKIENVSESSWVAQRKEKVDSYAQKNAIKLDDKTVDYVLKRLYQEAALPDMIIRSNRKGWKFSSIKIVNINTALKNVAIKSVEAIGLDFGAVDCAISNDGKPYIIEVNTGPGLKGTAFDKYVEAFKAKLAELEKPAEPVKAPAKVPVKKVAAPKQAVAGVGADNAAPAINNEAMVHLMNEVSSPEEARRVLDLLMQKKG